MLRKYPNDLLARLQQSGLNAGEFRTQEEDVQGRRVFSIRFRESPVMFRFWADGSFTFSYGQCFYTSTYLGGVPHPEYRERSGKSGGFLHIQTNFNLWLESVRRLIADEALLAEDSALPDLWAELSVSNDSGGAIAPNNAPFDKPEADRVVLSLNEFKRQVESLHLLTTEQLAALTASVDQLAENAKRPGLGRRDWLAAAAGVLIEYVIKFALDSEPARQVLRLAGETLRWIAQTPFLLGR